MSNAGPDTLVPLDLPPGLFKNGTAYQAKGRWYDADLVRFWESTIQPIGGWSRAAQANGDPLPALGGIPRRAQSWRSNTGDRYVAFGTTKTLQLLLNSVLYNLTPAGFTACQVDTGAASTGGNGTYGDAAYGVGNYNQGQPSSTTLRDADTWQLDTFGQWLVAACTSDQKLYVWENDVTKLAVPATNAPPAHAVVVTPERFVVALGTLSNLADSTSFDPRYVRWAAQETIDTWSPLDTNTAGGFPLASDGGLMAGRRGRGETLLWTDADLWAMTYIGGVLVYSFRQCGDHCGLLAPNAATVVGGRAFWMGVDSFYTYDGYVTKIPSDVADFVFTNMNVNQRAKIWAVPFAEFGEIWWYYPSTNATECDSYVVYNYVEGHWTTGQLARTCGVPAGATALPILCGPSGAVYEHEFLSARPSETPTGTFLADGGEYGNGNYNADGALGYIELVPYLESGPVELGDGTELMSVQRFVPDILAFGDAEVTFYGASEPAAVEQSYGPYPLSSMTPLRFAARQLRIRFDQVKESGWRLGKLRLGLAPGGRR